MVFDEDPNDAYEHYQCEKCGGSIRRSQENKKVWECNTCDFTAMEARKAQNETIR